MELDIEKEIEKKSLFSKVKDIFKAKEIEEIEINEEDEQNFNYFKRKGTFKEFPTYVYSNNKFYTCLRIHTYNEDLKEAWLSRFSTLAGVTVELDIDSEDVTTIKKAINRNIEIEDLKKKRARSYSDAQDAIDNQIENRNLYNEIKNQRGLNKISLNFIVSAHSKQELHNRLERLNKELEKASIEGSIFINSVAEDLKVLKYKNATATIAPTSATKTFFPFNFQELIDPKGTFIGESRNGGLIVPDHTRRNQKEDRVSNDILVTGGTGKGKSSLVKNILKKEFLNNHQSIILDPEGEYSSLVKYLGGSVIDVENDSIINPLEYRTTRTKVKNTTDSKDDKLYDKIEGFNEHMNSLMIFLNILEPSLTSISLGRLKKYIEEFYLEYFIKYKGKNGFLSSYYDELECIKAEKKGESVELHVRNLSVEDIPLTDFPTFDILTTSVLYKIRSAKANSDTRDEEYTSLVLIEQTLIKISQDYSKYFVGSTTTNVNSDIISFNLKEIGDIDENVKNAIVFNILNIYCNRRIVENKKYNDNMKKENPDFIPRLLRIGLDEAHVYLNTSNKYFVKWFVNAVKRNRKYYACILLSSQSILDFKPLNVTSEVSENLLKIFNEMLYRYFMSQNLPKEGAEFSNIAGLISKEDINSINNFTQGEFLLKLPKRKIIGKHIITKFEAFNLYHT